ncbi:hypothetical protein Tco_0566621 [Tanacetum coccineum]
MDSIKQCIVERARHEQELQNRLKRLNERKLQIQECKIQDVNASNACSGDIDTIEINSLFSRTFSNKMIRIAASKAFSIIFTVLVITASLECLFVVPRLPYKSTSSFKELFEVSYRHGVLFIIDM